MTQVHHAKCRCCQLPINERKILDRELLRGAPITTLSQRFGVSRDSLYRHKSNHIGAAAALAVRKAAENHGVAVMDELDSLVERTKRILDQAEQKGQSKNALSAIQQLRNNLTLVAQVQNEIYKQQHKGELNEKELQEFKKWQHDRDHLGDRIRELSPEDREILQEVCIKKISGMNGLSKVKDYAKRSTIFQEFGPSIEDLETEENSLLSEKDDDPPIGEIVENPT